MTTLANGQSSWSHVCPTCHYSREWDTPRKADAERARCLLAGHQPSGIYPTELGPIEKPSKWRPGIDKRVGAKR